MGIMPKIAITSLNNWANKHGFGCKFYDIDIREIETWDSFLHINLLVAIEENLSIEAAQRVPGGYRDKIPPTSSSMAASRTWAVVFRSTFFSP